MVLQPAGLPSQAILLKNGVFAAFVFMPAAVNADYIETLRTCI